ncbi:MAG TPA: kelch repeat-containing protein [Ktedonobacteraceae bacterium]|nr:kelch repeat-containing protein [Ktedonobacteraceae bacterium]
MPITPVPWTSTSTSPLDTSTYVNHTATLLQNGTVLVAGGSGSAGTTTVLYDPDADTWTPTSGSLSMVRDADSTATLLPSGKVLIVGGKGTTGELYDPATDAWTLTGTLQVNRLESSATLLSNGTVLVVGGLANTASKTAELYDPSTDTWTATGSLRYSRINHTATLLSNGTVLVAGGAGAAGTAAELYDPTTGTWTVTGQLTVARQSHTATLLSDGKVLVAGGWVAADSSSTASKTAELYDPSTGTWAATFGPLNNAHMNHTATLTANGNVLVTGGGNTQQETATTEMYNPVTGIWTWTATSMVMVPTVSLSTPRTNHTATLFSGGNVLVVGGTGSAGTISAGTSAEYTLLPVTVTLFQASPYSVRGVVSCIVNGQYQYQNLPESPYVVGYSRSLLIPASATNMRVFCEGKGAGSAFWIKIFDTTYPTAVGKTYRLRGTANSPTYDEQTL